MKCKQTITRLDISPFAIHVWIQFSQFFVIFAPHLKHKMSQNSSNIHATD